MNRVLGRLASALGLRLFPGWVGDGLMAALVAAAWVEPGWFSPELPGDLKAVAVIEALALHATPFVLTVRTGRLPGWVLWAYAPFLAGLVFMVQTKLLLLLFAWHLASAAWRDGLGDQAYLTEIIRYVVIFLIMMGAAFGVAFLPVPELGWTADAVPSSAAMTRDDGSVKYGAVPALLTVYFTLRALWNLVWWTWERTGVVRQMAEAADERSHRPPPR